MNKRRRYKAKRRRRARRRYEDLKSLLMEKVPVAPIFSNRYEPGSASGHLELDALDKLTIPIIYDEVAAITPEQWRYIEKRRRFASMYSMSAERLKEELVGGQWPMKR